MRKARHPASGIAGVLKPATDSPEKLVEAMEAKLRRLLAEGYRPLTGFPRTSTRIFVVPAGRQRTFAIRASGAGMFAAVCQGAKDLDLAVVGNGGATVATDDRPGNDPEAKFTAPAPGLCSLVAINPSDTDGLVVMALLSR